ncbi:twin-arginine translocase subunit TatC [Candidatus Nitrosotenuis sp. DW1]|uniref:twin-arginine translocase subunit TatC n=1 Tax=Candidatus Nitrosotenuis sp. DW1 TaxID=2259672 RepID=UPI0015CDA6C0|nr:twin-arginine translocase subunit TatC [Candidatus Nitrosotenuis sp. DW1]QLH08847.1 twin-arginine translocase subunit TatC [Candidatus Nitrosotenuis sp. DW1]
MSELHGIFQHISELRKRVTRIAIAVIIVIIFILTFRLEHFVYNGITLYYPIPEPINNIAAQITNHMRQELVPESVQIIQTAPGQAFYAQMYVAAITGIVLSMPIIIREFTAFIRPALKENEVRATRSIAVPALVLFVSGVVFSYFTVIPFMLDFLYQYGEASGLITFLNVMDFVSFVLQFLLAFGVAFQLPLIMYAATASGITDAKFWRRNIRYAIVILVIIGAVVTPDGSGVTMWFISGPMIVLYLAGMVVIERRELRIKKTQQR